ESANETPTITFDEFNEWPEEKLNALVEGAAQSNHEKTDATITRADSYSFQVANPQFVRSDKNRQLINNQLEAWGITNPIYPDFVRAYEALKESGLLEIDK